MFKLLLTFLVGQISIAQDFDPEILKVIYSVNQQELTSQKTNCLSSEVIPEKRKITEQDYNNCALSLCGPPSREKSPWVTDDTFSSKIPPELKAQVNSLDGTLNKIYDKSVIKYKQTLENYIKTYDLKKIEQIKFDEIPYGLEQFQADQFRPYLKETLDPAKSYPDKFSYDLVNVPKGASKDFLFALKDYAKELGFYKNHLLVGDSAAPYTSEELARGITDQMKVVRESVVELELVLSPKDLSKFKENIVALEAQIISTPKNFRRIFDDIYSTFAYIRINKPIIYPNRTPVCLSESCKKVAINYIKEKNPQDAAKKLLAKLSIPEEKSFLLNRCKAGMLYDMMEESAAKDDARKVLRDSIEAVKKNFLPKYSEHSRKILNEHLNKLEVIEKTKSNHDAKSLVSNFKNFSESYLEEENPTPSTRKDFFNNEALKLSDNIDLISPLSFSFNPCQGYEVSKVTEFFDRNNKINISNHSCTYQDFGKNIVAHEVGHALSHAFQQIQLSESSMKKFWDARQCIIKTYNPPPPAFMNAVFQNDSLYVEEDMADIVAFISFNDEKSPFMCNLLRPSIDFKKYTDLKIMNKSGLDPHSQPFLRLLHEATYKDIVMPLSCQKILESEKDNVELKKCL